MDLTVQLLASVSLNRERCKVPAWVSLGKWLEDSAVFYCSSLLLEWQ